MPIREFECPNCGKKIEILQMGSSDKIVSPLCFEEKCEHAVMNSVISTSSFILSGGGWAKDGYSKR